MKLSEHLKLNLPNGDNTVQISVLTENFKKLDDSYKYTIDKVDAVEHLIENVDFSEIEEQIEELEKKLNSHTSDNNNPHKVTKHQIGLNKVDNTSDLEKPVSTAVKKEISKVSEVIGDLTNLQTENKDNLVNAINEIDELKLNKDGDTATGIIKAHNNTEYEVGQIRNIIISKNTPNISQMKNGDIWLKYE